ncbi:hypothetical protein RHRU231_600038 [Rhodococcus ruber]|uniref:Uncharacterized protein n=1 Tax=Rhodococcus ruber TaxID=1830 RepID=A0A098BP92_9NOCA|nr:hypothetical protein CSW53_23880 [Rhodococcus ruber]RQM33073.1 hypothetical protein TN91_16945 [Rhodococcus ruber]CDZ90105.1 hypothetical protein RHRU231_600038 [Rhodococcus ruber]
MPLPTAYGLGPAPIAIAMLTAAVTHRSRRIGFGHLPGPGFFLPLLPSVSVDAGLALGAVEAMAVGVFGALTCDAQPHLRRAAVDCGGLGGHRSGAGPSAIRRPVRLDR